MVQIIESNRKPTTGERLQGSIQPIMESVAKKRQELQQKKAIGDYLKGGGNVEDLPMDFQMQILRGQQEERKPFAKYGAQKEFMEGIGLGNTFGGERGSQRGQEPSQEHPSMQEPGTMDIGTVKVPRMFSEDDIVKMSMVNPSSAAQMRQHNQSVLDQSKHEEKMAFKEREVALREKKESPEYKREQSLASEQAKADIDYNKELQSAHKQHELKKQTLEKLEKLNEKGVTGKPYEKLLEKSGLINLTSEGRREFAADVKNLITDIRSILGAQFTGFEFQTILNAYPSADFSQEANRAIINNLKEFENIRSKEFQFANEIKKENGGKIPEDFHSKVNERLQDYANSRVPVIKDNVKKIMNEEYGVPDGHTLMFDPQGEPMSVPDDLIGELLDQGAMLP